MELMLAHVSLDNHDKQRRKGYQSCQSSIDGYEDCLQKGDGHIYVSCEDALLATGIREPETRYSKHLGDPQSVSKGVLMMKLCV